MKLHTRGTGHDARPGYVIFAVLIVVVVLALMAYRFTDAMTAEYRVGARASDDAQAKAAALSGLHYAAAVLSDRATFASELDSNPFDNSDIFERVEVPAAAGGPTRKTAYFDIRCVAAADGGVEQRFGVIDEGGKLNINSMIALDPTGEVLYNALLKIPNMTPEIADAIVDWVDADDTKRASGAESADYGSLSSPYKAKNGPLNSLDELLLVQGVTPELLYGGDRNRNGVYDDGDDSTDRGWADYLTVYGRELNVASDGQVRTYLNGENLTTLQQQLGPQLGDELTAYVLASKLFTVTAASTATTTVSGTTSGRSTQMTVTVQAGSSTGSTSQRATRAATLDELQAAVSTKMANTFTGGNRVKSVLDLVGTSIKLPRAADAKDTDPDVVAYSPLSDASKLDALATLMDRTTTKQAVEMVPRINVNTAPREVLMAIPGMTDAYADAIVSARASVLPSDPAYASAAWVITSAGIPPATFKTFEKYVTGSTMVYRVQSVGYFTEGGPVARMEAVIDTNQGAPRFLFVRDLTDLENPRGFDPAKTTKP
ncbi:type II secretion system protein GspK [Gemmata sp. JC673]|uniref:Type II secretion system protein GspK n=1 Tax=Gemmata algarum TaxID=2975278 RepID=A0ABU5F2P3_9BACT|nr:type II secretion system protein GspK [Gemmata algarum]MDY3561676.1 type II secretion system protein GspK [Gemmata algarum]